VRWTVWLNAFDQPVKQDAVNKLARALQKYEKRSVVRAQLMASTDILQAWLARNPQFVGHVDSAVWAEDLAERWGWIHPEPLVFLD
jgi:hypothetical protein